MSVFTGVARGDPLSVFEARPVVNIGDGHRVGSRFDDLNADRVVTGAVQQPPVGKVVAESGRVSPGITG